MLDLSVIGFPHYNTGLRNFASDLSVAYKQCLETAIYTRLHEPGEPGVGTAIFNTAFLIHQQINSIKPTGKKGKKREDPDLKVWLLELLKDGVSRAGQLQPRYSRSPSVASSSRLSASLQPEQSPVDYSTAAASSQALSAAPAYSRSAKPLQPSPFILSTSPQEFIGSRGSQGTPTP